jgi:hypothetical protein
MATMGSMVPQRLTVEDLNRDFSPLKAKLVPMESNARRPLHGFDSDAYATRSGLTVRAYIPEGSTLPKGGLVLDEGDFIFNRGVDKTDRNRASIQHISKMGTDAKGEPDTILVIVEAPKDYKFAGVTLTQ